MSVFTSKVTRVLELPTDPGQSVTIRKLAPRHIEKAQQQSQIKSVEMLKAIGGPAFLEEMQKLQKSKPGQTSDDVVADAVKADPMLNYDRDVLLTAGVVAWSYPDKMTPELVLEMEDATAEYIAREVLRLARPALFESEDDQKAAQKNV